MFKTETRIHDKNGATEEFITHITPEKEFSNCKHENAENCYLMLDCIIVNEDGSEDSFKGGFVRGKGGRMMLCPDCGALSWMGVNWESMGEWNKTDAKVHAVCEH